MNTTPDDVMLALWLDDELEGDALVAVEAWAADKPDQLAAREEVRRWRKQVAGAMPREIEPPFADFFNSRILKELEAKPVTEPQAAAKPSWWRAFWWMPATAAAGMAFAFVLGTRAGPETRSRVARAIPAVYTPDTGVKADYFASRPAEATVIVLEGVESIPDSLDLSSTVAVTPAVKEEKAASVSPESEPGGAK
jgi:hypothetical protein